MTWILNGKNPDAAPPTYDFSTTKINTPTYVKPCGNCRQRNCPDCGTYSLLPPAVTPPQEQVFTLEDVLRAAARMHEARVHLPEVADKMANHLADLLERERELEAEYDRGHADGVQLGKETGYQEGYREGWQNGYQEAYAAARAEFRGY